MTMADQVVLLQSGRIEQIAPPHELYEQPATEFAAHFIGSPPMNIVQLDLIDYATLLSAAGGRLPVADGTRGWSIGVRPEEIKLDQPGLPARVGAVDFLGAETVIRVMYGQQTLFARTNGRARLVPGDEVMVSWPPDAVHVFDEKGLRQSGQDTNP
jgi:sn-glycerol 3-phosphate transport system ATP-binding protein